MRPESASITTSFILRYKSVARSIDSLYWLETIYRNLFAQTKNMVVNGPIIPIEIIIESEGDKLLPCKYLIRMTHECGEQ